MMMDGYIPKFSGFLSGVLESRKINQGLAEAEDSVIRKKPKIKMDRVNMVGLIKRSW